MNSEPITNNNFNNSNNFDDNKLTSQQYELLSTNVFYCPSLQRKIKKLSVNDKTTSNVILPPPFPLLPLKRQNGLHLPLHFPLIPLLRQNELPCEPFNREEIEELIKNGINVEYNLQLLEENDRSLEWKNQVEMHYELVDEEFELISSLSKIQIA